MDGLPIEIGPCVWDEKPPVEEQAEAGTVWVMNTVSIDRVAEPPHSLELVALDKTVDIEDGGADVVTPVIRDDDGDEIELTLIETFPDELSIADDGRGVGVAAMVEPVPDDAVEFAEDGGIEVDGMVGIEPLPKTAVEF